MRECSWPKALRCWRKEGSFLNRFPERSWIESPVALRQRLDRRKPTRIGNGNLYKIAHFEPAWIGKDSNFVRCSILYRRTLAIAPRLTKSRRAPQLLSTSRANGGT